MIRRFEEEVISEFDTDDLDEQLLLAYQEKLNYKGSYLDLLNKRHLLNKKEDVCSFKKAAILLFSKDPEKYIPSENETVNFLGLDLRYENSKYDWYIPPHVIENVRDSLRHLTNINSNIKMKLNFSKTITRMEQIVSGYQHCYSDADSKNLKDFNNRLQIEKENAISLLFQGLGIDIKTIHPQYMKFLLDSN